MQQNPNPAPIHAEMAEVPEDLEIPKDLGRAGAVVQKSIEHMLGMELDALAVASALLGGAMEVLSRVLDEAAIVKVLQNAIASVEAGHLRRSAAAEEPAKAQEAEPKEQAG